jgi:hypothetical protein
MLMLMIVAGVGLLVLAQGASAAGDSWAGAAAIPYARYGAVAAPLPGGKVLVTSGDENNGPTADSEIYDPTTDSWWAAAAIPDARYGAVAAALPDGTVLVTGGYNNNGYLADTEIYTPTTPAVATSTSVDCGSAKVMIGVAATCTATVTDTSSSPSNPTGTVSFSSNTPKATFSGSPCTLAATNGSSSSSSCQVSYTPAGSTSTVTGAYGGDGGHTGSSGQATVKVLLRPTKTTFSCGESSLAPGTSTTCTATVADTAQGLTSAPTGKVVFSGNKTDSFTNTSPCTLAPIDNKTASCTTTYMPTAGPNKHSITARYQGGGTHAGSAGSTPISVT